jgi:RHS repeat-associated protein
MLGRGFNGEKYRFGFNGKEKNSELNSDNYDFGARIYDGRLGRWFSVDPASNKYPFNSPYVFTANSVLVLTELDGKDYTLVFDTKTKQITIQAQFQVVKSEDINENINTRNNVREAIEMYNNTKDFQVSIIENGQEVIYTVGFELTLVDNREDGCGPLNTIEVMDSKTIASRTDKPEAGGFCQYNKIGLERGLNDPECNAMKHEIGHALGMDHEDGDGYLMSENVVWEEVQVGQRNIESTLNRVGIGSEKLKDVGNGIGRGNISRPNGPVIFEQKDMDKWRNSLENGKIQESNN